MFLWLVAAELVTEMVEMKKMYKEMDEVGKGYVTWCGNT